jgi:hypothetical protein
MIHDRIKSKGSMTARMQSYDWYLDASMSEQFAASLTNPESRIPGKEKHFVPGANIPRADHAKLIFEQGVNLDRDEILLSISSQVSSGTFVKAWGAFWTMLVAIVSASYVR